MRRSRRPALLHGENPWRRDTMLGSQITTGPSAVLVLAPFVAAFGTIDVATFVFWICFVAVLAAADLRGGSEWGVPLTLLYLLGALGIDAAQYWALEELYFPMLLLAGAAWLARKGQWRLVGAALALNIGWRINYSMLALGFVAWTVEAAHSDGRLRRMAQGGVVASVLVLGTVFAIVGRAVLPAVPLANGKDLHGPAAFWMAMPVFVRGVAGLLAAVAALRTLRPLALPHPFWHLACTAFVAHAFVWYSSHSQDYLLMLVIPALWALAWTTATPEAVAIGGGRGPTVSRKQRRRAR